MGAARGRFSPCVAAALPPLGVGLCLNVKFCQSAKQDSAVGADFGEGRRNPSSLVATKVEVRPSQRVDRAFCIARPLSAMISMVGSSQTMRGLEAGGSWPR